VIGRLRGVLLEKQPPWLLLDVQGVGYELEAPMTTFYRLPETGAEVTLLTHVVVREDAHLLYGFADVRDRSLFRELIRVSGVGARLALAILSGMEADAFARCIYEGDAASLTRLPGIGRKTAERLVVEMRDRLDAWASTTVAADALSGTYGASGSRGTERGDAVSALVALGFKPPEASRAVRAVAEEGMNTDELIRRALKHVVK
jgi:Holliday junction DNA helicase RuvA